MEKEKQTKTKKTVGTKKKAGKVRKALAKAFVDTTNSVVTAAQIIVKREPKPKNCHIVKNIAYDSCDKKLNTLNIFFPDKHFVGEDVEVFGKSKNKLEKLSNLKTKTNKKAKTIFYFHGGSFSTLDKKYFNNFCSKLSDLGYLVFNINYRLVPKVKIETCYDDCQNAVNFCLKNFKKQIDKNNIYFCGDSAGATISSMLACRQNLNNVFGKIQIKGLLLYYGVYDLNMITGITRTFLDNMFIIQYDNEDQFSLAYKYSPIHLIDKNFPPCFITSGDVDGLNGQSMLLIETLTKLSVDFSQLIFYSRPDAFHGFLNTPKLKSYKQSFKALVEFLKTH